MSRVVRGGRDWPLRWYPPWIRSTRRLNNASASPSSEDKSSGHQTASADGGLLAGAVICCVGSAGTLLTVWRERLAAGDQQGDVVVVVGQPEIVQEPVAGFFQRAVECFQNAQERVEALVDGVVARFDQSVGVEDQLVTRVEADSGGLEGDATHAEWGAGGHVEQLGMPAVADEDGGRWPALAMRHSPRWGS